MDLRMISGETFPSSHNLLTIAFHRILDITSLNGDYVAKAKATAMRVKIGILRGHLIVLRPLFEKMVIMLLGWTRYSVFSILGTERAGKMLIHEYSS